jgi:hypothetical protein
MQPEQKVRTPQCPEPGRKAAERSGFKSHQTASRCKWLKSPAEREGLLDESPSRPQSLFQATRWSHPEARVVSTPGVPDPSQGALQKTADALLSPEGADGQMSGWRVAEQSGDRQERGHHSKAGNGWRPASADGDTAPVCAVLKREIARLTKGLGERPGQSSVR